jgi:hypothetical protein
VMVPGCDPEVGVVAGRKRRNAIYMFTVYYLVDRTGYIRIQLDPVLDLVHICTAAVVCLYHKARAL